MFYFFFGISRASVRDDGLVWIAGRHTNFFDLSMIFILKYSQHFSQDFSHVFTKIDFRCLPLFCRVWNFFSSLVEVWNFFRDFFLACLSKNIKSHSKVSMTNIKIRNFVNALMFNPLFFMLKIKFSEDFSKFFLCNLKF